MVFFFELFAADTPFSFPTYLDEVSPICDQDPWSLECKPIDEQEHAGGRTFAFERDLRNYLERNLALIEPGLRIFEEEEISGVEFPADGRFIDLLAIDNNGNFVVIELKVSNGYDRVVGQILRYMAWVKANLAGGRSVRGVIVASQISEDLKLAASLIPGLRLVEYEISFSLKPVL